jgi:hypothetical protein
MPVPLFASPRTAVNSVSTRLREPPHALNRDDEDQRRPDLPE